MSISLYYTARRDRPLSSEEHRDIERLIAAASVDDDLEAYAQSGRGLNWESFCRYDPSDPTEPGVIFEGATKLPDNSEDAVWTGVQHWAGLLSRIRQVIPDAAWQVHVDDHDLHWDASRGAYDLEQ